MKRPLNNPSDAAFLFGVSALGLAAIVVPPYLLGSMAPQSGAGFLPLVFNAIEKLETLPTSVLVFILGACASFARPHLWLLTGFSPVYLVGLLAIVDMAFHPTTHNLFPFELLVYAIIALPCLAGAFFGKYVRRKWTGTSS